MNRGKRFKFAVLACIGLGCVGCKPLPWPESPLYQPPADQPGWEGPASQEEAIAEIAGHYAHYDVVAYEEETDQGPMRSFIISYGFTDFLVEHGQLIEEDRFCHAEHRLNSSLVKTEFSDAATQAILPRRAVVHVSQRDGNWEIWRPATPTLIGIDGDPDLPLSTDPEDPMINDDDGDGKPGVTVGMKLAGRIDAEIYIARREVFQNHLVLHSDGSLWGYVEDDSEQLVIGATLGILDRPSNPDQHPDVGLSPMVLVPVAHTIDTCDELMEARHGLFPAEPAFE
jgi:hypothetical protein